MRKGVEMSGEGHFWVQAAAGRVFIWPLDPQLRPRIHPCRSSRKAVSKELLQVRNSPGSCLKWLPGPRGG